MADKAIEQQLADIASEAIRQWFNRVAETYPVDTAGMLKRQKDPFANPVGSTTRDSLKKLYHMLRGKFDREAVADALDPLIRIRAVQAFNPSLATGFVFFLKDILRHHLKSQFTADNFVHTWFELESRIDAFGLVAFDIFMKCREKVYELKVSTDREKTYRAFARAGLIKEPLDDKKEE